MASILSSSLGLKEFIPVHGLVHPILEAVATIAMMTSSNRIIFRATGPLCGEFTGHRWIPLTKASDAELWYFLSARPEQTVE